MKKPKIKNIEGTHLDMLILPGKKAAIISTGKASTDGAVDSKALPKAESAQWAKWGTNNKFPQEVVEDLELNALTWRALEKRKTVHFGRGITAYKVVDGKNVPLLDGPVVEWMDSNNVNTKWPDLIAALEIFANAWPEMILNRDGTQINRINVLDPAYCRYETMQNTGRIDNIFYSAQWPTPSQDVYTKIPTWNPAKFKGTKYPDKKFIYPVFYRSFNRSYYSMAIWNGVRENGWLDISNNIPAIKKAIQDNQVTLKYHIQIPDNYFTKRYPSGQYSKEDIEAKKAEKIADLQDFLASRDKAGNSLVTFSFYDEQLKQEYPGWKVTPIDNRFHEGDYLPDSQAANSEILFAIGVDPALIGAGIPGGLSGAGSGSDKREAFWMLNAEMGIYRSISLSPLYFIRDFNGWGSDIYFDYMVVDTSQTQRQHPTKINQNIDANA